ncbi:MAG: hypothetical protein LCI00_28150 [Chloroflexi bacterium]|nr:hypothetical protein [Chloroflexota bacterium]MCC6896824.1 hypothetical protein [Anaerolineae bacterium]
MREVQAIIERTVRLNEHYQNLHLSVQDFGSDIKPGQSLLARLAEETWDPYLREQWWPVGIKKDEIIVERPGSITYEPGQVVSLLGAVGQPFRYKRTLRNVLLIADDTAPSPLVMSIPWLISNRVSVTLVLAGQANQYPTNKLPPELEVIHANDDLSWQNMVMTVGWADQVFVVVKGDDEMRRMTRVWERFKNLRASVDKQYLFAVMQPPQPCGVGACGGCLLTLREGEVCTICTQGPAIDMTSIPFPE